MFRPGFKSDEQAENFRSAAMLHGRGGVLSPVCGAKTRGGGTCRSVPILEGKGRCLRHCSDHAARAFAARQKRDLGAGRITLEAFNRAEAKRARNRLGYAWTKNPSLPGQTIDLGADETGFLDETRALGVDVDGLFPAVQDWLRWRYRRCLIDRQDHAAWVRAVRHDLPRRIAAADEAMIWVRAGGGDKRIKASRALKAALRAGRCGTLEGGQDSQVAFRLPLPPKDQTCASYPPPSAPVIPWRGCSGTVSGKRALPDRPRALPVPVDPAGARPKSPGRPRRVPDTPDEIAALRAVLMAAGPEARRMFDALTGDADQLTFLRDLRDYCHAPHDPGAQRRWAGWLRALGATKGRI